MLAVAVAVSATSLMTKQVDAASSDSYFELSFDLEAPRWEEYGSGSSVSWNVEANATVKNISGAPRTGTLSFYFYNYDDRTPMHQGNISDHVGLDSGGALQVQITDVYPYTHDWDGGFTVLGNDLYSEYNMSCLDNVSTTCYWTSYGNILSHKETQALVCQINH